jgi:hypothetical protein
MTGLIIVIKGSYGLGLAFCPRALIRCKKRCFSKNNKSNYEKTGPIHEPLMRN